MGDGKVRCLFLFAVLSATTSTAADMDGATLAWKYHCVTCHGQKGIAKSDRYPNLAGQNTAYLEGRLRYFRERLEPGNQMNAQAAPLSDDEIRALATYFNQPDPER